MTTMSTECVLFATRIFSIRLLKNEFICTFEVVGFPGKYFELRPRHYIYNKLIDSRHTWYPRGLTLLHGKDHSKNAHSEGKHALGEKTIADVCEALIGGAMLSGGAANRFDMAVKAVSAMVDSPDHTASCWQEYYSHYSLPTYQSIAADGSELDLAKKIEAKLGYRFSHPRLLRSAFTHPSYPSAWAKVPCYQRLEFLGDSLLDMACVEDLFKRFPERDPQWLTEHKVSNLQAKTIYNYVESF